MSFRSKSLDDEGYVTHQDSLELRPSDTPTSFAKGAKGYDSGRTAEVILNQQPVLALTKNKCEKPI